MKQFDKIIKYEFYKTALFIAVEQENVEMVKLLLAQHEIDVNSISVFIYIFIQFFILLLITL